MPNIHQAERNSTHFFMKERVDFKTALNICDQRHTHQPTTYSALQQEPKPTKATRTTNITPSTLTNTQTQPNRKIINYEDLLAHPNKQENPQQLAYALDEDMDRTDASNRNQNKRHIPETDLKLRSQTREKSSLLTKPLKAKDKSEKTCISNINLINKLPKKSNLLKTDD